MVLTYLGSTFSWASGFLICGDTCYTSFDRTKPGNRAWMYRSLGFKKRATTTGKVPIPQSIREEIEFHFFFFSWGSSQSWKK